MKIHLDTDLGGDMDDLCALAYLLRRPDVELTGITTSAEENGRRAGYTRRALAIEGRAHIPLAAGADVALGLFRDRPGYSPDENYWPGGAVKPEPGPLEAALELLRASIEAGSVIAVVGPFTNLRLLEQAYPGSLARARVVLMGGWLHMPRTGFPQWGWDNDYNIQLDVTSARFVIEHCHLPTLVPLTVTVETALQRAALPRLRQAGELGRLLAYQAESFALEYRNEELLAPVCPGLPADIINFQHDPLACAIALGWEEGIQTETLELGIEIEDGWLRMAARPGGMPVRWVSAIDGEAFNQHWLEVVAGKIVY